jgi:dTDP-4-dehydrorhamnose 3,5-epimerase
MSFSFKRLSIPDVVLIEPRVHQDDRGFFMETYKVSEFAAFGIQERFVQDNHSKSTRAVLRGLHYQRNPMAQGKLVRVLEGEIFDVAVDLRKGSTTYSQWVGMTLSAADKRMLYLPEGFAHGFCILSDTAEVLYKTTREYSPEHDQGIIWNDPDLAISWPIRQPIVSNKDAVLPRLKATDTGFIFKEKV